MYFFSPNDVGLDYDKYLGSRNFYLYTTYTLRYLAFIYILKTLMT